MKYSHSNWYKKWGQASLIKQTRLPVTLSIFTNAMPYTNSDFIEALSLFDRRFIKLDAGDEQTLNQVNHPKCELCLDDLADAMAQLDGVVIQTMVITGFVDNRSSILNQRYSELVARARASEIQLYTINKKPAYNGIRPVSEQNLHKIAEKVQLKIINVPVRAYYQGSPSGFPNDIPPIANYARIHSYEHS